MSTESETNTMPDIDEVLAISDPGEKNRDQHTAIDRLMVNVGSKLFN